MTKFIKNIFLFLNIISIVGLGLVKICSFVNPNDFIFSIYPSIFLTPILVFNIGFILFWIFFKKWYFVLSLLFLILFSSVLRSGFSISWNKENKNKKDKITLLSYNTMNLSKFKKHTPTSPNLALKYILDQDADIVCLQEFAYSNSSRNFDIDDMFKYFRNYPYKHFVPKRRIWNSVIGIATFSKYPIINQRAIQYPSTANLSICSDIKINKDTIRIINNHLESNRITTRDIYQTSNLKDNFNSKKAKDLTDKLSKKLRIAYKRRAIQADSVANIIEKSPYKTICCGDFNDVPCSYVYTKVKGNRLKDAFQEAGFGFGLTFVKSLYRFRIDYILCDKDFVVNKFRIGRLKASDHYPIQTELYFSDKK